ncbi:GntR family transcriptional regulator [Streptomyces sp. NPDC020983]|uniref:GntR family transcriptional regulator n=1 Tax=Streptomyces sp. NPDC020983 TaxID=3365106 RepID=UPI00378A7EDC
MPESGGPAAPVRRSSLRQQIADALRDEVLTGRLQAGRHFTVKEIAELYGVSATPVREALVDLAAQGLLDVEQHRGFQVRQFTAADFRSLTEARAFVVEAFFRELAGQGGVGDVPADVLASVRRRAEAAAQAAQAGSLDVLVGCDLRFWRELSAIRGNPHICDFLDRLRTQTWIYAVPHLRALADPAGVCWSGHVALVDAVARGDIAAAHALVAECNAHTRALIEKLAPARS